MKSRLFIKVFSGYFIVTLFLTILVFVTSSQIIQYYYRNELSTTITDLCVVTGRLVSPSIDDGSDKIRALITEAGPKPKTRVIILNADGLVLADTASNSNTLSTIASSREFISALNGTIGTYVDANKSGKGDILSAAAPITRGGKTVGVVMISLPIETGVTPIPPILFVAVCVFVFFFAILGALVFSARLSNPIRELSHAAKRVSEGDFTARVFLDRNDEIKYLADRFNFMTERIDFLFRQAVQQKDELLQIISSLEEGLLVVDKSDRIVLFNESLGSIAYERPVQGRFYWEAVRDITINEMIDKTKRDRKSRHEQIEINDRSYSCSVMYISSKDEILVALHDITEIKDLENIKKEFVTNASHELRTPLTAIKGFVETIETADKKKRSYYLQIIKRNTDRMISIIRDLLVLSEFEQKNVILQLGDVNVEEMVRGILTMFEKDIQDKKLDAAVIVENGPVIISADSFKLEQLFINLIDNAVKYTDRGRITVSLSLAGRLFIARVQDTGIGIPRHDIPHIFERFYRVDKSRSRTFGGTGLGLSIVKYIVLLHNGDIRVESTVGVGTTFTLTIPQGTAR